MSTNLDEMLKEAPSLTLDPFTEPSAAVADVVATANEVQVLEGAAQALKEVPNDVPEAVLTPE